VAAKPTPVIYSVDRPRADAPPPVADSTGLALHVEETDKGHRPPAEGDSITQPA